MESYRKDAEQHGAVVALNCEVVGGKVAGAATHCIINVFLCPAVVQVHSAHKQLVTLRAAASIYGLACDEQLLLLAGKVKTLQVKDRESGQMSAIQAHMIVNAAGLYAQSLAEKLQGLPGETIPGHWFARGHYCTMEGRVTELRVDQLNLPYGLHRVV